jgi:hypothetical protein
MSLYFHLAERVRERERERERKSEREREREKVKEKEGKVPRDSRPGERPCIPFTASQ